MKTVLVLVLVGLIVVFWLMSNAFSKPVLNRMQNYYEDDKEGRDAANVFIGLMLIIAFVLGYMAD